MERAKLFDRMDEMADVMGFEELAWDIARYMSVDDLEKCLKYIDNMHETNVFYEGPYISEVQDWTGRVLESFTFEEYEQDCEWEAILKREEIARGQAVKEWDADSTKCINDGYNNVEELENAILDDLYVYSYDRNGKWLAVDFG